MTSQESNPTLIERINNKNELNLNAGLKEFFILIFFYLLPIRSSSVKRYIKNLNKAFYKLDKFTS